jgi:hypothetical protein
MTEAIKKPRRYPRGTEPVEVFHTRLNLTEEAPALKAHADKLNLTISAALRDLTRRALNLPSLFDNHS